MTAGNILFFSGVGLLIFTICLGILFWIKRPQYNPENAMVRETKKGTTQKLHNGYPTDRLTIRREPSTPPHFVQKPPASGAEGTCTELFPDETEPLKTTEKLEAQLSLPNQTLPLSGETMPLTNSGETMPLALLTVSLESETEFLDKEEPMTPQDNNGTVPLIPD